MWVAFFGIGCSAIGLGTSLLLMGRRPVWVFVALLNVAMLWIQAAKLTGWLP